jgi:hypothetical protein
VADFQFRTGPATVGNIVAQGDSDSIGCGIVVDRMVQAETISHQVSVFTCCRSRAA